MEGHEEYEQAPWKAKRASFSDWIVLAVLVLGIIILAHVV
jgi:hypothetical protein